MDNADGVVLDSIFQEKELWNEHKRRNDVQTSFVKYQPCEPLLTNNLSLGRPIGIACDTYMSPASLERHDLSLH